MNTRSKDLKHENIKVSQAVLWTVFSTWNIFFVFILDLLLLNNYLSQYFLLTIFCLGVTSIHVKVFVVTCGLKIVQGSSALKVSTE